MNQTMWTVTVQRRVQISVLPVQVQENLYALIRQIGTLRPRQRQLVELWETESRHVIIVT